MHYMALLNTLIWNWYEWICMKLAGSQLFKDHTLHFYVRKYFIKYKHTVRFNSLIWKASSKFRNICICFKIKITFHCLETEF